MKPRSFASVKALIAALATRDQPVEFFGSWYHRKAEDVVKFSAETTEVHTDDLDLFFSAAPGTREAKSDLRSLLSRKLGALHAYRVDQNGVVDRFVIGRAAWSKVWIGVRYRTRSQAGIAFRGPADKFSANALG